jgi:hypothetical protein
MPDYKNSKIYKIISPSNPDLVYYGSTTQKLSMRMAGHRRDAKTVSTNNTTSKEILCFDDAIILLIEQFSCNNKEELHKKEGEYILNNDCVNKIVAGRNKKQWYEDNKEKIKEHKKQYRKDNKEQIKKYSEDNREHIKEQKKKYHEDNKEHIKEQKKKYYELKKEHINERNKKYYELNKEEIKERHKKYRENNK